MVETLEDLIAFCKQPEGPPLKKKIVLHETSQESFKDLDNFALEDPAQRQIKKVQNKASFIFNPLKNDLVKRADGGRAVSPVLGEQRPLNISATSIQKSPSPMSKQSNHSGDSNTLMQDSSRGMIKNQSRTQPSGGIDLTKEEIDMKELRNTTFMVDQSLRSARVLQPRILLLSSDKSQFKGLSLPVEEDTEDFERKESTKKIK